MTSLLADLALGPVIGLWLEETTTITGVGLLWSIMAKTLAAIATSTTTTASACRVCQGEELSSTLIALVQL